MLVVDDDGDTRDFLIVVLQEGGARLTSAKSVRDAIAFLQQYQPDIPIGNIGMPEADGYALIDQVRTSPSPEIALTAYPREEDSKKSLDAGFHMHPAKPVEPAQLISVMLELAQRST